MTLTFMRPAIALALALSLAACGGKATFPVSGTIITPVNYEGLVLSTNGMDLPVKPGTTSFTFPNPLSYGEVYNVVQKSLPKHQNCTIGVYPGPNGTTYNGPTDTAGRFGAINVGVLCTTNVIALGGTIKGLASGASLQLINGSEGTPLTVAGTGADIIFALPSVEYGKTYGITVLAQPDTEVCTVSNGTGTMLSANDEAPTGIEVNCTPK